MAEVKCIVVVDFEVQEEPSFEAYFWTNAIVEIEPQSSCLLGSEWLNGKEPCVPVIRLLVLSTGKRISAQLL